MAFTVTINYGSGDVALTNYSGDNLVLNKTFKKTTSVHSKGFKSVTGEAFFDIIANTTLINTLLSLARDQDITVSIQQDGADWFTGYIRPLTKYKDTINLSTVSLKCVDAGWALHSKPTASVEWTPTDSLTVCNTSTTAESLIHKILSEAGFSGTITAFDVSTPIQYFRLYNREYFEVLSDICFSYHLSFYFDESGDFILYDWGEAAAAVSSAGTVSEGNMIGALSVDRDAKIADTPRVKYYSIEDKAGITLADVWPQFIISSTADVSTTGGACWWRKLSRLGGTKIWLDVVASKVISLPASDMDDDVVGYKSSVISCRYIGFGGFSYQNPVFSGESDGYVNLGGTWRNTLSVDVTGSGSAVYAEVRPLFDLDVTGTLDAPIATFTPNASIEYPARIERVTVSAVGAVRELAGKATGYDIGDGIKDYDAPYCYSESVAEEVATALSENLKYGEYKYSWGSQQDLTVGSYYTVTNSTFNISSLVRITKKTHQIKPPDHDFYIYEAQRYSGFSSVYSGATSGAVGLIAPADGDEGLNIIDGNTLPASEDITISETGLFLMYDKLGFYDATAAEWTAYIQNDGKFKFSGDANNSIEWDGSNLVIKGDMTLSGSSIMQGTVSTGNGIESDNFNAGVAGWQIDGDGDAEFNSLTVRSSVFESVFASYTGAMTIGFDGSGTIASPDEGDRRALIDTDEISFQEYTGGAWSSYNQITLGGADSDGVFYPFLSCRGVVHPKAVPVNTSEDGELLPAGFIFDFERVVDYYAPVGFFDVAHSFVFYSVAKSGTWKSSGAYSVCGTSAGTSGKIRSVGGNGVDLEIAISNDCTMSGWVYRSSTGSAPSGSIEILYAENIETTTLHTVKIAIEYILSSNTVRLYAKYDDGTEYEYNSTGTVIATSEAHHIGLLWDASDETATLIVDDEEVESLDLSAETFAAFSNISDKTVGAELGLIPTDATSPGVYLDELVICPDERFDPAVLISHYTNGRQWSTSGQTDKDLILKAGPGGRVITDYPAGYLYGLETEADTDTAHDVLINIGKCRSYTDLYNIELFNGIIKKIDVAWTAGSNSGGLFTGSVAADTAYHLFLIRKASDGSIDAGWDTDIDCSNIPTGYTAYRRIASFLTDASANILKTYQRNDYFIYDIAIEDFSETTVSTTATAITISVPADINPIARMSGTVYNNATTFIRIGSTDMDGSAMATVMRTHLDARPAAGVFDIEADASSQIYYLSTDGVLSSNLSFTTHGWIDDRGQHGGK